MEDKTLMVLFAIIGLVVLESIALLKGINGTILSVVVATIAGLAGFTLRPLVDKTFKKFKK